MVYCLCVKNVKMPLFVLIRSFVRDTSEPVLWDVYNYIEHMISIHWSFMHCHRSSSFKISSIKQQVYIFIYILSPSM